MRAQAVDTDESGYGNLMSESSTALSEPCWGEELSERVVRPSTTVLPYLNRMFDTVGNDCSDELYQGRGLSRSAAHSPHGKQFPKLIPLVTKHVVKELSTRRKNEIALDMFYFARTIRDLLLRPSTW
jgi:hypothetical protein